MATAERPPSMLPSIKCSGCGADTPISAMGEHVCPPQQEQKEVAAPTSTSTFQQSNLPVVTLPATDRQHPVMNKNNLARPPARTARTAPPRINPTAANQPYNGRQELLSPVASFRTPLTGKPAHSPGKPARSPGMRIVTSPMPSPSPRLPREPLQVLTGNMDCAFPPFPTARSKAAARAPDAHHYPPRSPIDMARTPNNASTRNPPAIKVDVPPASPTHASASPISFERPVSPALSVAPSPQIPASPALSQASSSSTGSNSINRDGRPIPQRPVRPEPLDGFLAMLKSESEAAGQQAPNMTIRSNTFPLPPATPTSPEHGPILRSPSAPTDRQRRPTVSTPSHSAPHNTLPTISTAFTATLPPLPSATELQKHSHHNHHPQVIHAPSDSASSASSTQSFNSEASPSPSASSSISMLSTTLGDFADASLVVPSLQIKPKTNNRLSPEDASKPAPLTTRRQQLPTLRVEGLSGTFKRSQSTSPLRNSHEPDSPESPVAPGFSAQRSSSPVSSPITSSPISSTLPEHGFQSRTISSRRPGTSSKHVCRGCSEPIQGKSVKAADGRLTGRYHKHCFVCRTCRSAFATADFYVIDNNPYCEHHYHELNNSLCAHCDRGIEGPYLETQQNQKFHPCCFTCIDCHKTLSDDYFEIAGKVYCEQHAFASVRRDEGLGSKRNMERRTTRFMVM